MIDNILFCLHDSPMCNTKNRFSYTSWDCTSNKPLRSDTYTGAFRNTPGALCSPGY